jgi:hypothetical protein
MPEKIRPINELPATNATRSGDKSWSTKSVLAPQTGDNGTLSSLTLQTII